MDTLKQALEKLHRSVKDLEDAVVFSIQKQNLHKEKIETLQEAIQTTYDRIDHALSVLDAPDESGEEKQEEICLLSS